MDERLLYPSTAEKTSDLSFSSYSNGLSLIQGAASAASLTAIAEKTTVFRLVSVTQRNTGLFETSGDGYANVFI